MRICVYGASSEDIDKIYKDEGERLGEAMAERGHSLVFGGGKYGLMGAVMRGITRLGGKSVGIAPRFFLNRGVLCENCTEFIFTDTLRQRKQIMDDSSDAFIAAAGGIGTYDELFESLTLFQLGQSKKPVGILNTNGYFNELTDMLEATYKKGFTSKTVPELLAVSESPEELLDMLEGRIKK